MSGTHAVITSSASVDGTAGTFVELATNSPIPLQDGSKKFHGVVFSGAPLAQVAAKPASLRIKLTSSSLDIVGEIFTYGAGYGGGIATNDQQPYFPIDFLQFDVAAAGGEKCKAEVTVVGYVEMASGVPGVAPFNCPHPSLGPALGTPVGQSVQTFGSKLLPFYVKRADKTDRTFTGYANEILTPNTAVIINYSVAYGK